MSCNCNCESCSAQCGSHEHEHDHHHCDPFQWLANLEFFGVKLGLIQTRLLFDEVGSPDRKLKFIHLAGSNGKGSTGAMLEAALRGAGYKTGFYSSPHLVNVNERFRINGVPADNTIVAKALEEVRDAAERMYFEGYRITYFEATTAAAAWIFAEENVDFVIWETGMGGRLDSTNIVIPLASVITSISLEHKEYLGNTLAEIAGEKAGIIKRGIPVFAGATIPQEAMNVIRERAEELDSPLTQAKLPADSKVIFENDIPYQTFNNETVTLSLPGPFQRGNAMLALNVLQSLAQEFGFSMEKALDALKQTRWDARFQVFPGENLIFDGAHNPDCAGVLAEALQEIYPGEKFDFIYGSFADKDTVQFLQKLIPLAASFRFVPVESQRKSRDPQELCELLQRNEPALPVLKMSLEEALQKPAEHKKVLCGSLHLCGEALALRQKLDYHSSQY